MGQVGITIRVRLHSNLHDSQNGKQQREIPKPAREEIRKAFTKRDSGDADANDDGNRKRDFPKRKLICRVRIEWRQPRWPKKLPQVCNTANESVAQP